MLPKNPAARKAGGSQSVKTDRETSGRIFGCRQRLDAPEESAGPTLERGGDAAPKLGTRPVTSPNDPLPFFSGGSPSAFPLGPTGGANP
jgi:hypothetical protein